MSRILVKALKFDGSVHRQWKADLIDESEEMWTLYGEFEQRISHPDIGLIEPGTGSFEYYWKNDWFNIFRFNEPGGELKCFYCNVNMPPDMSNGVLSYRDLDLDILVSPDFSYRVLDELEFETNARKYEYPFETVEKAKAQISVLQEMIETKEFPFGEK